LRWSNECSTLKARNSYKAWGAAAENSGFFLAAYFSVLPLGIFGGRNAFLARFLPRLQEPAMKVV